MLTSRQCFVPALIVAWGALPISACLGLEIGDIPEATLATAIEKAVQTPRAAASVPAGQTPSHKAIFQYGLASVVVGVTPSGTPIGYRLELLAAIPLDTPGEEEAHIRSTVRTLTPALGNHLRVSLDALPGLAQLDMTHPKAGEAASDQLRGFIADRNKQWQSSLAETVHRFNTDVQQISHQYGAGSVLAIGLRPCAPPRCKVNRVRGTQAERFGKVYEWLKSYGLTKVGDAYVLDLRDTMSALRVSLPIDYGWHADFDKEALRAALVAGANRARKMHEPLPYSAAQLADLPREAVAHIADAFDSASVAAASLRSDPNAILHGISDELGRSRLKECVALRGKFDVSKAADCAGYQQLTPKIIAECIAGGLCMPKFGSRVNLDSIALNAYASISDYAEQAPLPRAVLGTERQFAAAVEKCNGLSGEQASYCLVKTSLGHDAQTSATFECVERANGHGLMALADCAGDRVPNAQRAQIACFKHNSGDSPALALCASANSLPQNTQKLIECANDLGKSRTTYSDVVSCLGGEKTPELACLEKHQDDWKAAAACAMGEHVPASVKSALKCAAEHTDSAVGFGLCLVTNEGSGEAQRIAACYVEGQGVPAAVAVCLASNNLTEDQRIVLECAAETNGVAYATAVCVGGKMVMRDMADCHGRNLGEGNCFGEGNEFRKLFKQLGIPIGPHSLPANVINVQLHIADATAGPVLKVGGELIAELAQAGARSKILGDINRPLTLLGPAGQLADDFCQHNQCSKPGVLMVNSTKAVGGAATKGAQDLGRKAKKCVTNLGRCTH
jgi:hypothetical protein